MSQSNVVEIGVAAALRKRHVGQNIAMIAPVGGCAPGRQRAPGWGEVPDECVQPKCKYQHFSMNSINLAAAGVAVLVATPNVSMFVQRLIATTTGAAGFSLTGLFVNNEPQWVRGSVFHSDSFAQIGDENTALNGDGIIPGSGLEITVTNLDGVNAQSIFLRFMGPSA